MGCSNLKHLPAGEKLYTGASVIVTTDGTSKSKQHEGMLEDLIRPEPNARFLGMRPKLWFYNIAGENPKKGLRKWIRNKLGEDPVLLSEVDPQLISSLMKSKLNTKGFFVSQVEYEVHEKEQTAEISYLVYVSAPYTYRNITYANGNDSLNSAIRQARDGALIKEGDKYDLDILIEERTRIDKQLKNKGYYYFSPDLLVFQMDTTAGTRQTDVLLGVKPDAPSKAIIPYTLDSIYLIPGYSVTRKTRPALRDTVYEYGLNFVERYSNYRHKVLSRYIMLKEGDIYTRKNHDLTISRLMAMGVFRFVNVRFDDTLKDGKGYLNAEINLTQQAPKMIKLDLDVSGKSNNYTGPTITARYTNRNLWRGAELLQLNINGTYETQLTGTQKGFNSWELGAGIQLVTPRFITPFKIRHESTLNVPKTKFDLQFRLLHRVQFFDMNGFNFTYGYLWKETEEKQYEVNPISINYAKLLHTTAAFDSLLFNNPYLRRSFEEQFTFGSTASFTINTQSGVPDRDEYYFNVLLDVSGNALSLAHRVITGERSTDERPYELFGARFAQYSKLSTDFRYYTNWDPNNRLAARIMLGVGIPYGNSIIMPYSKQFFSGGANSIRAFLPRSLGPGSYRADDAVTQGYFDQSGDMKIELNLEYRFGIVSVLKGALFTDAGNVWMVRKNEILPGGEFNTGRFLKEIAVGAGVGLRLDLSFFLLRLDLGIPLRKPYLPEHERWVIKDVDFGDKNWRRDNLVWNIAVGYPF